MSASRLHGDAAAIERELPRLVGLAEALGAAAADLAALGEEESSIGRAASGLRGGTAAVAGFARRLEAAHRDVAAALAAYAALADLPGAEAAWAGDLAALRVADAATGLDAEGAAARIGDAVLEPLVSGVISVASFIAWPGLLALLAAEGAKRIAVSDARHPPAVREHGIADYAGLIERNGELDAEGGEARAEIEVVELLDEAGRPRLEDGHPVWRVTIPSTVNDRLVGGGPNTWASDALLKLAPAVESPYERAVEEAMRQASIGADDPVMLVGWSQGGIVAAKLAARGDFAIRAVVVAGAPIDDVPIPPDVDVVAVQHLTDPIPDADRAPAVQRPNWVTTTAANGGFVEAHDVRRYAESMRATIDEGGDPRLDRIRADNAMFFAARERVRIFDAEQVG